MRSCVLLLYSNLLGILSYRSILRKSSSTTFRGLEQDEIEFINKLPSDAKAFIKKQIHIKDNIIQRKDVDIKHKDDIIRLKDNLKDAEVALLMFNLAQVNEKYLKATGGLTIYRLIEEVEKRPEIRMLRGTLKKELNEARFPTREELWNKIAGDDNKSITYKELNKLNAEGVNIGLLVSEIYDNASIYTP